MRSFKSSSSRRFWTEDQLAVEADLAPSPANPASFDASGGNRRLKSHPVVFVH